MSIRESTIKRLYGMSGNKCAMPDCKSPLIIGDVVVGEICHIRARRKGGARYDPGLSATERDEFDNLVLLCGTCHKLIDSSPGDYSSEWLQSIKALHERKTLGPVDLSVEDSRRALMILAKHMAHSQTKTASNNFLGEGSAFSSATDGGVAVSIAGPHQGPITIRMPATKEGPRPFPANSIGADANMTNYIEYLCELYVKYMLPIEPDENVSWAKIGKHIKTKFHLKKKTRNHLSAERFQDLVNFLICDKLAYTPVGRKHLRLGYPLCRTFEEFRHGPM